jgi:hypothetical protein
MRLYGSRKQIAARNHVSLRDPSLQSFVDAASVAFKRFASDPNSSRTVTQAFSALGLVTAPSTKQPSQLPICTYLSQVLDVDTPERSLQTLIQCLKAIKPRLHWRQRTTNASASSNFPDGHANTMFIGPDGLEERQDIWFGATLMAPHVRYPDHEHPPEEVYLVLSAGQWRQADGEWFSPGVGGSFYNRPGIRHAMRSLDTPLFALWMLRVDT